VRGGIPQLGGRVESGGSEGGGQGGSSEAMDRAWEGNSNPGCWVYVEGS